MKSLINPDMPEYMKNRAQRFLFFIPVVFIFVIGFLVTGSKDVAIFFLLLMFILGYSVHDMNRKTQTGKYRFVKALCIGRSEDDNFIKKKIKQGAEYEFKIWDLTGKEEDAEYVYLREKGGIHYRKNRLYYMTFIACGYLDNHSFIYAEEVKKENRQERS